MDESGFITAFSDPTTTQSYLSAPVDTSSSVSTPTTQPDFNVSGQTTDAKSVLGGFASVISAAGNAVIGVQNAQSQGAINSAISAAAQAQALQSIATQGKLAQLQNQTQLAQAQAAFNKAAGVATSSGGLVTIIAIAGLVLAAIQLHKKG